ncbi:hypothetical protein DRO34_07390 [Candidatus Bathyarchaeota archaeon]|nr:MAG: hypothetical protein DRO34_07390 [Candidatus Bathyarchaeota archaeon]
MRKVTGIASPLRERIIRSASRLKPAFLMPNPLSSFETPLLRSPLPTFEFIFNFEIIIQFVCRTKLHINIRDTLTIFEERRE